MNDFGYCRVAAAVPAVALADPMTNAGRIIDMMTQADDKGVSMILFPELSVTGYTCADLFNQTLLLSRAGDAVAHIVRASSSLKCAATVGMPLMLEGSLYNCAVIIRSGLIHGIVPKIYIPDYNEFYEARWFTSGRHLNDLSFSAKALGLSYSGQEDYEIPTGTNLIFEIDDVKYGVELCEDLWVPNPPSSRLAMSGADIILNLSATDENIGKHSYLLDLIRQQSARCRCGYVYASAGAGESSTDLVFSGNGIIAEDGSLLARSPRFSRQASLTAADIDVEKLRADRRKFSTFNQGVAYDMLRPSLTVRCHKPVPQDTVSTDSDKPGLTKQEMGTVSAAENVFLPDRPVARLPFVDDNPSRRDENCGEIIAIQTWGLEQRLEATGCKKLVVGISGGLDSTLALLVAVRAFDRLGLDRKGIIGITMPGYGTTTRTRSNASDLMRLLGVTSMEISIADAVDLHFRDIGQSKEVHDATYENGQARERTQILMDMANKTGGMVLGTGDLSELALGWCTYNGDHMSMYAVNASIPKTLVRHLVEWFASHADKETARVLRDIIDTPISPELIPAEDGADTIAQKTEDLVGPYELHDFFLYHTLRNGFSPKKIYMLAKKAFEGEYDDAILKKWLRNFYGRFFSQQFKRSCMPDGPKVGSVCLSPRGDWRMPSDATSRLWLSEVDGLN